MPRSLRLTGILFAVVPFMEAALANANLTPQVSLSQNWSNVSLITANDDWNSVAGIVGYLGANLTNVNDVDPQTITADETTIDVIANQSNPNTLTAGGVAEFDGLANPVVALQGSGTAAAPFLRLVLKTTGQAGITVSYNLRDIDGSTDNAVTQVAVQYRIGSTGGFTNLPAGYVADATTGPSLATLVTPVSVLLPSAADNQPIVQVRIITSNASGVDEWIGIDDIVVTAAPPCFTDLVAGLTAVDDPAVAWGDYDGDGDLDALVAGQASTRLYRNSGGPNPTFVDVMAGLPAVIGGAVAWGDYDRDGDLDLLLAGSGITRIYRNTGGPTPFFIDSLSGLPGLTDCAVAWGDYDNDGDLDLLLTGFISVGAPYNSLIYRNNGGANPTFTNINAGLVGIRKGSVAWGDYDIDGDLDILITGQTNNVLLPVIYTNSGGPSPTFFDTGLGRSDAPNQVVAWGDYDYDGDLDYVLGGISGTVWTNLTVPVGDPYFSDDIPQVGPAAENGSVSWGDFDNNGRLDFLMVGYDFFNEGFASLIENSDAFPYPIFSYKATGLPGLGYSGTSSAAAVGDCDNDGDLDVLMAGRGALSTMVTRIYRNACGPANTPPQAPTGLVAISAGSAVTFQWTAATDAQTPSAGLSYNLRVGTAPGLGDIVPPMSLASGYRQVPALGNAGCKTSMTIRLPPGGLFYWSVQAIDGAFAGSPFAPEQTIGGVSGVVDPPLPLAYAVWSGGPNPFSGATAIHFSQPARGLVSVAIFDVAGRLVRKLIDQDLDAGSFSRSWDGTDDAGGAVASGLYFVRMTAAATTRSYRLSLIR